MTLYGHADALAKQTGEWVESGEVIARAGRSGGLGASGLYFEVRHDGRAADPITWLSKR
jgi:septal ring factor EnvC (AmiA/AmiB activator)